MNPYHTVIKELIWSDECRRIKNPLIRLLDIRRKEHHSKPPVPGRPSAEWTDVRVMKK